MDAARTTSFFDLYRNYTIYVVVSWLPINMLVGFAVGTVGKLNEGLYTVLYFIGAFVIFWLAYKVLKSASSRGVGFQFSWQTMVLVSWTNPKVWLTLPAGYLAANFTGNLILDVFLFFVVGLPFFFAGVYLWGMIGRQGAKIAKGKLAWFNAFLLAGFGCYLLYQGLWAMGLRVS